MSFIPEKDGWSPIVFLKFTHVRSVARVVKKVLPLWHRLKNFSYSERNMYLTPAKASEISRFSVKLKLNLLSLLVLVLLSPVQ